MTEVEMGSVAVFPSSPLKKKKHTRPERNRREA
jgi:hypothetical protein